MPADLHVHSNLSDGEDSPEELVALAKSCGLTTISITDHDTTAATTRAESLGGSIGVEVVPGIEFTTEAYGAEIHILGYFIDIYNAKLIETLKTIQKSRTGRIYKMIEKLNALGVNITAQDVLNIANNESPGRPHVAKAMIKAGYVSGMKEAFDRYLENNGPAYVSHYKLSPDEAVKLITQANGIAVLAHPMVSNRDNIIQKLMKSGLKGIEVYYPTHSPEQLEKYKNIANKYGLLITGGTDYHGKHSGRRVGLGEMSIPDDLVEALKKKYEYICGN